MSETPDMDSDGRIFLDPYFDARVQTRLAVVDRAQAAQSQGQNRNAAVLIPLLREGGEWHLLFTRRSVEVQDHKGQVAFPGGAVEREDADAKAAALRESWEEIGLPAKSVRVLGQMPARNTITHYYVTPVVGVIAWPFPIRMQASEVSRVFTIPLRWLAKPENHTRREVERPGGFRGMVDFFAEYDGELLWGISAAITLEFLDLVR